MLLHQQCGYIGNTVGMGHLFPAERLHCVDTLLGYAIGRIDFGLGAAEDSHARIDEFDVVLVEFENIVQYSKSKVLPNRVENTKLTS